MAPETRSSHPATSAQGHPISVDLPDPVHPTPSSGSAPLAPAPIPNPSDLSLPPLHPFSHRTPSAEPAVVTGAVMTEPGKSLLEDVPSRATHGDERLSQSQIDLNVTAELEVPHDLSITLGDESPDMGNDGDRAANIATRDPATVSPANTGPEPEIKSESDLPTLDTMADSSIPRKPSTSSKPKTEGLDSNRRYLCYVCNKLFTRRRSVKDHINKIHPGHTFDGEKSLEVIVDPTTGQPLDPAIIPPQPQPSPPPANVSATIKPEPSVSVSGSRASSVDTFTTPAPVIGKKRPAPSSSTTHATAIMKKGTASKVKSNTTPASKKQKMSEPESITGTPTFRSPSGTPASSRFSKTPAPRTKKQSSISVASSPAPSESRMSVEAPADDENEAYTPNTNDENDDEVFCICRKGDNHTWMIACDGQCEDWFHGKCVGIQERDGDLIDKYICPNCTREGFQTTWKRMCRRLGCRKPARVTDFPPSKYCSPDCGRMFFVELIQRSDPDAVVSQGGQHVIEPPKRIKHKKIKKEEKNPVDPASEDQDRFDSAYKDDGSPLPPQLHSGFANGMTRHPHGPSINMPGDDDGSDPGYETEDSSDHEPLPSRGGALRAGEIKALIAKYEGIEQWRTMGTKPTTAPIDAEGDSKLKYDDYEEKQLAIVASKMAEHRNRISALTTREVFLGLVKKRSAIVTEELRKENPKLKDVCGFDPRLSWSEAEFLQWRDSSDGNLALATEALGPAAEILKDETKSSDDEDEDDNVGSTSHGVCSKNRCQRHGKWHKVQTAEIRFEQDSISKSIDKLEREEAAIKDRAILRAWETKDE